MARTRTVYVHQTAYMRGRQTRVGVSPRKRLTANIIMSVGVIWLIIGIPMAAADDDLFLIGIVNISIGVMLMVTAGILYFIGQKNQAEVNIPDNIMYNPPPPGTYPMQQQQTQYFSQPGIYSSEVGGYSSQPEVHAYPLQLQAYPPPGYSPQYTSQFEPGSNQSHPDMPINSQTSSALPNHMFDQKPLEGGFHLPYENPPPYSP